MLNRSSSTSRKCSTTSTPAEKERVIAQKPKQDSVQRSPFRDLNNGVSRNSSGRSASSISSSVSIEAPRGCLRFFLSNPTSAKTPFSHRPKSKLTTKSAPNAKIRALNSSSSSTFSRSMKKSNENHPLKPKKKKKQPSLSSIAPRSKLLKDLDNFKSNVPPGSEKFAEKLKKFDNAGKTFEHLSNPDVVDCTPVGKLACGSVLDCANYDNSNSNGEKGSSSSTRTPPVQASVSPELLRGSSIIGSANTETPMTCYGAGHVISGVTDKRKCRPKGILTVGVGLDSSGNIEGDNVASSNDSTGHFIKNLTSSRSSLIPLPSEASMSWHLSPCSEEGGGGQEGDSANKWCQKGNSVGFDAPDSSSLLSSASERATNLCNNAYYIDAVNSDATPRGRKTRITLLSPRKLPEFQDTFECASGKVVERLSSSSQLSTLDSKVVLSDGKRNRAGESSPISVGSLSSENVMQTPKSGSSSEKYVFPPWLDVERSTESHLETAVDSLTEVLRLQSLSPQSHKSLWDPLGLNFQFTDQKSPSTSIDVNQHQNILKNHASWICDSSFENEQSETRISWREGLASRIFEMDDLDCCRFLSDEENDDAEGSSENQLKVHHESHDEQKNGLSIVDFRPPEFLDHEPSVGSKGKAKASLLKSNSCAESISTDGGGLVASGDSDWTLCYKNQLFDV